MYKPILIDITASGGSWHTRSFSCLWLRVLSWSFYYSWVSNKTHLAIGFTIKTELSTGYWPCWEGQTLSDARKGMRTTLLCVVPRFSEEVLHILSYFKDNVMTDQNNMI